MSKVVSPATTTTSLASAGDDSAVEVLRGVDAGAVPLCELDLVGARGQAPDVVGAIGVGGQTVDRLPATQAVGAESAHVDAETEGARRVRHPPRDVPCDREHGVDAGGRPANGHRDPIGRRGRRDVVIILRGVEARLVGELDEEAAPGKAADVVAAVLAGQRPAVVVAIVMGVDGGVHADLHVRETHAVLVGDRAADVATHGEFRVDAGGGVGRVQVDVLAGLDRQLVVVVFRCVDAGVVTEPDAIVAGRQAAEVVAASGGVGRGVTDVVPAA